MVKTTRLLAAVFAVALMLAACSKPVAREVTPDWPSGGQTVTDAPNGGVAQLPSAAPTQEIARQNLTPDTWAVYWYLCGSDLESNGGEATRDLREMLAVTLPDNVQVIIETGGAAAWETESISANAIGRYRYAGNTLTRLSDEPDANMGDASTFADFLWFCNANYPAEHQAVILWNHGGGSLGGVAYDEKYDYDSLSLSELGAVFSLAPALSGAYELIGFDACLMATVDTAEAIADYGRYMVASEENEPGCGWEYTGLFSALAQNTAMDGAAFGKAICDTFYSGCAAEGVADMTTLSVVDLRKAGTLLAAYRALGDEALLGGVREKEPYLASFSNAARNAENYGGNNEQSGYFDMVDVGDIVKKGGMSLFPQHGEAVLNALNDCVVYQIKGQYRSEATGLACYYGYDGKLTTLKRYADLADNPGFEYFYEYALDGKISQDGMDYVEKLQRESGEVQNAPQTLANLPDLNGIPLTLSSNGHYTLNVGGELSNSIAFVYIDILLCAAVNPGEIYDIYDLGSSRAVDSSRQSSGVFTDTFDGKAAAMRENPYIAYDYVYLDVMDRKPGEYTLYSCPVMLTRVEADGSVPNGDRCQLTVNYNEKSGKYEILGAKQESQKAGMADKTMRQLTTEDILIPIPRMAWPTGINSDEWTPLHWPEVNADDNFMFRAAGAEIYDETFIDGYYRVRFEMVDYAGKHYVSGDGWYRCENEKLTPVYASEVNMPSIGE